MSINKNDISFLSPPSFSFSLNGQRVGQFLRQTSFDPATGALGIEAYNFPATTQEFSITINETSGTGKDVRIAVFAGGEALTEAESAGAEIVGGKELATKVASEQKLDADIVISTPEMMAEVGQLGKILGPQGLMPNPKTGTVIPNVAKAVEDFKKGKVEIKNDKLGNVHLSIGKVSFDEAKLAENLDEVIAVLTKAKPSSSKGEFIKTVHMSSTMGPSISDDINI